MVEFLNAIFIESETLDELEQISPLLFNDFDRTKTYIGFAKDRKQFVKFRYDGAFSDGVWQRMAAPDPVAKIISDNYTLTMYDDIIIVKNMTGNIDITLPDTSTIFQDDAKTKKWTIIREDATANTLRLVPESAYDTINGDADYSFVENYESKTVVAGDLIYYFMASYQTPTTGSGLTQQQVEGLI